MILSMGPYLYRNSFYIQTSVGVRPNIRQLSFQLTDKVISLS